MNGKCYFILKYILENNFQKIFGESNGAGGQFSVYENSPLLSTKETVISLDYVGKWWNNDILFNFIMQGTCNIVSPAKKGKFDIIK